MDQIEHCISFLAGKAAQQVTRRARALLAPAGVTPVQYAVLKVVAGTGGLSGAEIGGRLVLDSASITGVVDRLESLGLVRRQADPRDRRVHLVMATERAEALMPALDDAMDHLNAEAAAILGKDKDAVVERLRALGTEAKWVSDV